jgi:hypothetical protein
MRRNVEVVRKSDAALLGSDAIPITRKFYELNAKKATENLMQFISTVLPDEKLCVMYFDEAHELGASYWILLRLLYNQHVPTRMWYVFMGTKLGSFYYYAPNPDNSQSPVFLVGT